MRKLFCEQDFNLLTNLLTNCKAIALSLENNMRLFKNLRNYSNNTINWCLDTHQTVASVDPELLILIIIEPIKVEKKKTSVECIILYWPNQLITISKSQYLTGWQYDLEEDLK